MKYILPKVRLDILFFLTVIFAAFSTDAFSQVIEVTEVPADSLSTEADLVDADTTIDGNLSADYFSGVTIQAIDLLDTVPLTEIKKGSFISLQQMVRGNVAGMYAQEPSGEPGTVQNMFVRGLNSPLLNKKDLFDAQPVVYVNGIPLIGENPFAYDVQEYDFNRIGPATNYYANLSPEDITSIKVVKDPMALAALGPNAANGAIWITTKNAHSGLRSISVNSYIGMAQRPALDQVNASFENDFRQPFYEKYGTISDALRYPSFLRDSTNGDYYGPSNWTDLYYRSKPVHAIDLSLSGGTERANFRFSANEAKSNGNADGTSLNRYGVSFFINMLPLKWLTVSSMIKGNRSERDRNHSIRDRLAEQRYIPDLSNPLAPNKSVYNEYLSLFNDVSDKNQLSQVQGFVGLKADVGHLLINSKISIDYNEGIREVFWPTLLLEGNNFLSNYFGYDQRFIVSNSVSYDFELSNSQTLSVQGVQQIQEDINKYDYSYGYNGPNDFIKVDAIPGDTQEPDNHANGTSNFQSFQIPNRMTPRLASYYFKTDYTLENVFHLGALIRTDGSSNMQPDHRWFMSYGFSGSFNAREVLMPDAGLNGLNVHASYARIGRPFHDDRFGVGPQYTSDLGWEGEPTMHSYVGIGGLSRPFTSGWIGYDIPWQYSDKLDVGIDVSFMDERIKGSLSFYSNDDKNLLLPVPIPTEYGFTGAYESGMQINNKGIELTLIGELLRNERGLNWTFDANISTNKNELKKLPGGLKSVVVGDRKLEVGKAADSYWLLNTGGIYEADNQVPVNPNTNNPMTFEGVPLKAGDARWQDVNGDFVIDDEDKVLQGHFMPAYYGGFGSELAYRGWSFGFHFDFVLKRDLLNEYASKRLDFVNEQNSNDIRSVKEINFWENRVDRTLYPMYNPWSSTIPYRSDQILFLEDGSFMKLRTLSLSYDLARTTLFKGNKDEDPFNRFLIYVSASNLFTVTPFKTDDPEMAGYNGIYNGYGLPIPRTFTFGVQINL